MADGISGQNGFIMCWKTHVAVIYSYGIILTLVGRTNQVEVSRVADACHS
jgi:hypothetical protein